MELHKHTLTNTINNNGVETVWL